MALQNKFAHERNFDPAVRALGELYTRVQKPDTPVDIKTTIEKIFDIFDSKDAYCLEHTDPDSPNARMISEMTSAIEWKELRKERKVTTLYSSVWMSSAGQGKFLQFLIRMQTAKRVLEIGMFTGYVAMAMAEALPEDGAVVTCELDPYLVEKGRSVFDKTPLGKKIDIRGGPAIETLDDLAAEGQTFDIVYLDADKNGYLGYFKKILDRDLLTAGGTLVVDNAFEFGLAISNPKVPLYEFNNAVMNDNRVEQVMLPMYDGVSLIRRKGK